MRTGAKGVRLREALVVFQFVVSILLVIGTTVVFRQLEYIGRKDLGYSREQMLIVPIFMTDKSLARLTR